MEARPLIPILIPDMPSADELLPWLRRIDETLMYSNRGPLVQELEAVIADLVGAPAVTVSNGTVALELAIRTLRMPRGSLVLVPAMTFAATALAVWNAQMRPVLCDVDPVTWQMTPELALEGAQGQMVRAVVPVATMGAPVDLDRWERFARDVRIPVVIDAAGALTSQRVSRYTRLTNTYSLHGTKAIGAGEGGLVGSNDKFLLDTVRRMTSFGHWGTNAKMSEYHAAVALCSLQRFPQRIDRMQPISRLYGNLLAMLPVKLARPPQPDDTLLSVLLPEGKPAAAVADALELEGVQTKQWYRPFIDELPQFSGSPRAYSLPTTYVLRERLLGLPFHTRLTADDVTRVCAALGRALMDSVHP